MERLLFAAFSHPYHAGHAALHLRMHGYDFADLSLVSAENADEVRVLSRDNGELQGGFEEALTGMGLSTEEASYYALLVEGDGAFLIVPVPDREREGAVRTVLRVHDVLRVSGAALAHFS